MTSAPDAAYPRPKGRGLRGAELINLKTSGVSLFNESGSASFDEINPIQETLLGAAVIFICHR